MPSRPCPRTFATGFFWHVSHRFSGRVRHRRTTMTALMRAWSARRPRSATMERRHRRRRLRPSLGLPRCSDLPIPVWSTPAWRLAVSPASAACSVTGTTVSLVSAGPCAIQADEAGNAEYDPATPVTQSFTISLASQTITFPAITSFSWSGGSAILAATASSGLAVSYSIAAGSCSVAGTTLTATGAGNCVVAADQAGNGTYGAASQVTVTAVVTPAGQTIAFGPLANKLMTDGAVTVSATGGRHLCDRGKPGRRFQLQRCTAGTRRSRSRSRRRRSRFPRSPRSPGTARRP
jgi:hypothetical protein